jgi:hypothetical protein
MIHYLTEWDCAPLALFYALKCQVVSKERLRTIVTLFNGVADELRLNTDFTNSSLGFDEIVEAASKHREKRKGINQHDFTKGTIDLYNVILSELGTLIYEVD